MKLFIVLILFYLVCGCTISVPKSADAISDQITIEKDSFRSETWIKSPIYRSRQGITDTFPVRLSFRALYEKESLKFIQLYVISSNVSWGFYHSANGEDGKDLSFTEVDSSVDSSGGFVTTDEHYAMSIPIGYLERMSSKNWEIKVYGKRNEGIFVVPEPLSKAFLDKLRCYEENQCK